MRAQCKGHLWDSPKRVTAFLKSALKLMSPTHIFTNSQSLHTSSFPLLTGVKRSLTTWLCFKLLQEQSEIQFAKVKQGRSMRILLGPRKCCGVPPPWSACGQARDVTETAIENSLDSPGQSAPGLLPG